MTAKEIIPAYLSANGRSRVSEIANNTDYSTSHIRNTASNLVDEDEINGEKVPVMIPAAIINDQFEVLTSSKKQLVDIVRKHAPHLVPQAEAMSGDELQDFIGDELAERTFALDSEAWEFW